MKTLFLPLLFLLFTLGSCYKEEPDDNTNPQVSSGFAIKNFEAIDAIPELDLILGLQNGKPSAYNLNTKTISTIKNWDLTNGYSILNGRAVTCKTAAGNKINIVDILDSVVIGTFTSKVGSLSSCKVGGNHVATMERANFNDYVVIYELSSRNLLNSSGSIDISPKNFYISHDGKKVTLTQEFLGKFYCTCFDIAAGGTPVELNSKINIVTYKCVIGKLYFNTSSSITIDEEGSVFNNLFQTVGSISTSFPSPTTDYFRFFISSGSNKIHALSKSAVTSYSTNNLLENTTAPYIYNTQTFNFHNSFGTNWDNKDWIILTVKDQAGLYSTLAKQIL